METPISTSERSIFPYLALGTGILALSLSAMFVRWANAPGPVTGFYRLSIAVLLLSPFFYLRCKRNCTISKENIIFPVLGGIFTGLDLALWNTSIEYTTAANATLLGNSAPLWVAIAAIVIFKERLKKDFWFGLILALAGATLIVGFDFLLHPTLGIGDTMALGAGIFYAGYFLSTQQGRKFLDPLTYMWLVATIASIVLFVICLILGQPLIGYSTNTWLVFLSTAIVSQIIGYLTVSYALGHLPASIVSPTMIGQPVLTTVLAIPLLGEVPQVPQLIGGSLALAGIFIIHQVYNRDRRIAIRR